jgi:hypothetical protein
MVTISRTETDDGVTILTVRAKTAQEAVAVFQAIKELDARMVADYGLAEAIQEANDGGCP